MERRSFKLWKISIRGFKYKVLKKENLDQHKKCLISLTMDIVLELPIRQLLMIHRADHMQFVALTCEMKRAGLLVSFSWLIWLVLRELRIPSRITDSAESRELRSISHFLH